MTKRKRAAPTGTAPFQHDSGLLACRAPAWPLPTEGEAGPDGGLAALVEAVRNAGVERRAFVNQRTDLQRAGERTVISAHIAGQIERLVGKENATRHGGRHGADRRDAIVEAIDVVFERVEPASQS